MNKKLLYFLSFALIANTLALFLPLGWPNPFVIASLLASGITYGYFLFILAKKPAPLRWVHILLTSSVILLILSWALALIATLSTLHYFLTDPLAQTSDLASLEWIAPEALNLFHLFFLLISTLIVRILLLTNKHKFTKKSGTKALLPLYK